MFPEKTGGEVPIRPGRAVTVPDVGRTCHGEAIARALQKPDEAVDRRCVLDDLVAAETDGVIGEYRRRIDYGEAAAAVSGIGDVPVRGNEDHAVAARSAGFGAGRGGVAAAAESSPVDAD